jgi:hypothetical protein
MSTANSPAGDDQDLVRLALLIWGFSLALPLVMAGSDSVLVMAPTSGSDAWLRGRG